MKYLLDTNAISEFCKRRMDSGFTAWTATVNPLENAISVLTLGELESSIARQQDTIQVERLQTWYESEILQEFRSRTLLFDTSIAQQWGKMYGASIRAGRKLPIVASMLAATATFHDLILVTRNTRDFINTPTRILCPWTD
jgi:toxin FitB